MKNKKLTLTEPGIEESYISPKFRTTSLTKSEKKIAAGIYAYMKGPSNQRIIDLEENQNSRTRDKLDLLEDRHGGDEETIREIAEIKLKEDFKAKYQLFGLVSKLPLIGQSAKRRLEKERGRNIKWTKENLVDISVRSLSERYFINVPGLLGDSLGSTVFEIDKKENFETVRTDLKRIEEASTPESQKVAGKFIQAVKETRVRNSHEE